MIVVFAAFTFGNFLVVKMIGFTLAVAVLIDATLVRMVIGPALLCIAGDWNWWPGGLKRPNQGTDTALRTSAASGWSYNGYPSPLLRKIFKK